MRRRNENYWWNSEIARLRREARRAFRKAIKTNTEEDWEAKKQAQSSFKKSVRKANRESWRKFTESMNNQDPTARLMKTIRRNDTFRINSVKKT